MNSFIGTCNNYALEIDQLNITAIQPPVIIINTIDTEYLRPGTYYYEIKLRQKQEDSEMYQVDTIISKRKFIIKE